MPASIAPPGKPALCGSSAQTCHLHGSFRSLLHKTASWRSSSAQTAHLSSFYQVNRPCVDHPLLRQATCMASSTAFCVKVACWGRPLLLLQWKCPAVKITIFFLLTGIQPYSNRTPPPLPPVQNVFDLGVDECLDIWRGEREREKEKGMWSYVFCVAWILDFLDCYHCCTIHFLCMHTFIFAYQGIGFLGCVHACICLCVISVRETRAQDHWPPRTTLFVWFLMTGRDEEHCVNDCWWQGESRNIVCVISDDRERQGTLYQWFLMTGRDEEHCMCDFWWQGETRNFVCVISDDRERWGTLYVWFLMTGRDKRGIAGGQEEHPHTAVSVHHASVRHPQHHTCGRYALPSLCCRYSLVSLLAGLRSSSGFLSLWS